MLVFKVSEEIPDNREFYEVRKFDENFKRVPRSIYEDDRGFHKCETKTYQRIKFKTDSGIVNVVAGDEISDKFFKSFIECEKYMREAVDSRTAINDAVEARNTEIEKQNAEIKYLRNELFSNDILLCCRSAFKNQIESSLYYKIGKFLRLI